MVYKDNRRKALSESDYSSANPRSEPFSPDNSNMSNTRNTFRIQTTGPSTAANAAALPLINNDAANMFAGGRSSLASGSHRAVPGSLSTVAFSDHSFHRLPGVPQHHANADDDDSKITPTTPSKLSASNSQTIDHAVHSTPVASSSSSTTSRYVQITTIEDGIITGRHIFDRYPIKTPHVAETGSSSVPKTEDEKKEHGYQFLCEVPDKCPGQWQKTLSERRRAVSDLFGRNKKCTRALTRMISICRMHYQANSYGNKWGLLRIAFALDQLQRNEEDHPGLRYTVILKESEAQRLLNFLEDQPDVEVPHNGHHRGRPFRVDLPLLKHIWQIWIGTQQDRLNCRGMLMFFYELIERGLIKNIPSIEMLPEITEPSGAKQYAINAGAYQKKLLLAAAQKRYDYQVLSRPEDIIALLEDAKHAAGGSPLIFDEDEDLGDHPTSGAAVQADGNEIRESRRPALRSSPPTLAGRISPPSPSPRFSASGIASLNGVNPYPTPELSPVLRALEASLEATIAVSRTLTDTPDEVIQHLLQAKSKLKGLEKRPSNRISKSAAFSKRGRM